MTKFMVLRIADDETVDEMKQIMNFRSIPFTLTDSSHNLTAPDASIMILPKKNDEECGSSAILNTSQDQSNQPSTSTASDVATGTAEIRSDGPVINIADLLKHSCEANVKIEDSKEEPPSAELAEFLSAASHRAPRNIKRYRRQLCTICGKTFIVPFFRSKMCHAAIHSEYKRYKCLGCPKRAVHQLTMRQHVRSHHREVEGAGESGKGYEDGMNEEEEVKLFMLTARCFPDSAYD